jgi:hypothetical protein
MLRDHIGRTKIRCGLMKAGNLLVSLLAFALKCHGSSSDPALSSGPIAIVAKLAVMHAETVSQNTSVARPIARITAYSVTWINESRQSNMLMQSTPALLHALENLHETARAANRDLSDDEHESAVLVQKILNGAKSADTAVEQNHKTRLDINMKTAQAQGLKIPGLHPPARRRN